MEAWQVALLVLCIILGLYLALIFVDVFFVLVFRRIFKKHNAALGVILHTNYDNVKKLFDLLNKNGVNVPYSLVETLNSIDANSFVNQETDECKKSRNNLAYLRSEMSYFINNDEMLSKNLEIRRSLESIDELNNDYRRLVAMYNADVLGFNYWINFLPTKYLKYIFRWKEKQII